MANINTGPAPVNTGGTITPILGPLDRSPGGVTTGLDPAIPTPQPQYYRPLDRAPAAVEPGVGLGTNPTASPAVSIPTFEVPVEVPVPELENVLVSTPIYIKVLLDGTVVTENTSALNFLGSGVTVSANGSTANITITAGGTNYGNSNVSTLLAAFGSNTLVTTGNITAGYFIGNGSQLTGLAATYGNSNVTTLLAALGSNIISGTGNITTTANISGGFILGNGSQLTGIASSYGNANVVANLAALGSNPVSTTGNITGGNILSGANVNATTHTGTTVSVTGNVTGGNITTAGLVVTTGNVSGGNIIAATLVQSATVSASGNVTGGNVLTAGIVSATGNVSGNYFIGNGRQLTSVSTSFENEIHVAQNGNDTSGDGTINYPYLTIQKGVDISANPLTDRRTVVIHPGTYIENVTVTFNNTQIITYDLTGASTTVSGTLTLANNAQRLAGLKITNLTIAGNTQAYINSCTVTGQLTKSSSGYVEMVDVDMSVSGNVQITGGGTTLIDSNKIVNLRVANASASVSLRNVNQVYSPEVTAGTLSMFNCFVQASGNTANAITASVGTVLQLFNTTIYNLGLTAPARISVGGFYQLSDTQYDRANSVLGTSLGAISFFQSANIDSVTVNTTVVATGNVTGGNVLTGGLISATGNITGGNILFGSGIVSGTGNITTTANISGGYILGNGSQLTGVNSVTVDVTDTNGLTTIYYPTFVENRTTAQIARADVDLTYRTDDNLLTVGNVSVTGNITGGNILGGANVNATTHTGTTVSVTGNITGGNLAISGNITSSIGFTGATITINNAPGGVEGAEIQWALPSPANTSLSGTFVQDVFQNGMRFFESSGNTRGLYMDLGNVPNGSSTAVGYRDIPQVSFAANATIAATDAGRHYYSTSASNLTLTIANNTSVSWTVGTAISIVNRGTANITIAGGTGVSLYLAGNSTAGNRTVTTYGMATVMNVAANVWMINGTVV